MDRMKLILILFSVLLILGCVEQTTFNNTAPNTIPKYASTPERTPTSPLTTVKPTETPSLTPTLQVTETPEKQSPTPVKTQAKLDIPGDSEYVWVDLNESIRTITIEGTTYETGLFGKAYVPKEIEPGKVYPIYILLSRNPEVSTLATIGWSFCIGPAFDIDIVNRELDLYLHFSTGPHAFDNFFEVWKKHWHLWSSGSAKVSYKIDEELYSLSLSELKPGEWNVYKIEVKAEIPDDEETEQLKIERSLGTLGEGFWWQWKDNLGIWIERGYDNIFLVGVYQREFNQIRICPAPSIVVGMFPAELELWLHFGIGFGGDEEDWDEEINHTKILEIPITMAERPSECNWDRIDWFEVKVSKDGYVKYIENHRSGFLHATATSDEREEEFTVFGEGVYSVTISGTFESNYGSETLSTTLYYLGKKNIKRGDTIEGYVKLVTSEKEKYVSALEDCYWIVTNKTVVVLPVAPTETTPSEENIESVTNITINI